MNRPASSATFPVAKEIVDGALEGAVSGTNFNTAPSAAAGERIWYQIISDDTTITVLFQHQAVPAGSPPATWNETGTQKIWETSGFGFNNGAMIGFAA